MAPLLSWIDYGATEEVWFESSNRHSSLESVFLGGGLCVTLMPCDLCEYSLIMSQMDTWKNSMPAHKRVTNSLMFPCEKVPFFPFAGGT